MDNDGGQIRTVNVVVIQAGVVDTITSYPDTDEGNSYAEKLYLKKCHEHHPLVTEEELEIHLEDGYCFFDGGSASVCICHS